MKYSRSVLDDRVRKISSNPIAIVFHELPADARLAAEKRRGVPRFFDRYAWTSIAISTVWLTALVGLGFMQGLDHGDDADHARAGALVALSFASAGITVGLTRLRTRAAQVMVSATLLMSILLVQSPGVASLLHLKPLDAENWLMAAVGGLVAGGVALLPSWLRRRTRVASSGTGTPPQP